TEVMEVRVRDERTRDVVNATFVEERLLELLQPGGSETVAPEPPRGMQQIEVRFIDRDLTAQCHHPTRSQQRQVEALAVVRGAGAERLDLGLDRLDERALCADVMKQVLTHHQLALTEVRDPKKKDVRPRATGQPGGLRIQPKDVLPPGRRLAAESEV